MADPPDTVGRIAIVARRELRTRTYGLRAVITVVVTVGLVVVVGTVGVALIGAGIAVAIVPADIVTVYTTYEGVDSPLLLARFTVLAMAYSLAILAVALAVSAAATSGRSVLVLTTAVLLALLVGTDLVLIDGFTSGWLGEETLDVAVVATPNGAFRGLVLETALGVVDETPRATRPLVAATGLLFWTVGGLLVSVLMSEQ